MQISRPLFRFLYMHLGDVEGLIDDTVEEGRGEESGEGEQGSGEEEDSDDNIQKKEKRKRCKPFTHMIPSCTAMIELCMYMYAFIAGV